MGFVISVRDRLLVRLLWVVFVLINGIVELSVFRKIGSHYNVGSYS